MLILYCSVRVLKTLSKSYKSVVCSGLMLLAFLFSFPDVLKADGAPYEVKDIGSVSWFAQAGNGLIFSGDTVATGTGVWKSDGSSGGTDEVYNMYKPQGFTQVGESFFFVADSNMDLNSELWLTDGTSAGTQNIKTINQVCECSSIYGLNSFKTMLFFQGYDGVHGWELWRSDGTPEGTVMVKNIRPDDAFNQGSYANPDFVFNDHLYFNADDGTHGQELWVSDGTDLGTYLFTDLNPGGSDSHSAPQKFINFGDKFLFSAYTDIEGMELWVSRGLVDGSNDGTQLVKDIFPGTNSSGEVNRSDPDNFVLFMGKVYFIAGTSYNTSNSSLMNYELWSTDGTAEGTTKVFGHPDWYGTYKPDLLTVVDNKLFFVAGDLEHQVELWVSDGSMLGTKLLKDIYPGRKDGFWNFPNGLTQVGDLLYFSADNGETGLELWKSDGTEEGTVLVKDISPGIESSRPDEFVVTPTHLFFRVNTMELWAIDRTVPSVVKGDFSWNLFFPGILSGKK